MYSYCSILERRSASSTRLAEERFERAPCGPPRERKSRHYQRGPCSVVASKSTSASAYCLSVSSKGRQLHSRHETSMWLFFATEAIDTAKSHALIVVVDCASPTCLQVPIRVSCNLLDSSHVVTYEYSTCTTTSMCRRCSGATSHHVLGMIRSVIRTQVQGHVQHQALVEVFFCGRKSKGRMPRSSNAVRAVPHFPHCWPHPGPCSPVRPDTQSSRTQEIAAAGARRGLSF